MILNKKNIDNTKNPLFLGDGLSLQRYDKFRYEKIFKLFRQHVAQLWTPEEIDISKDREQFDSLQDHEKFIFTKNLLYQTVMDSVVARGANTFSKYVTNNELEAYISAWQFFETIHSYSYTYIIKNVYANPSELLDTALEDKEIMARAKSVSASYDMLYFVDDAATECDDQDLVKKQIYLSLIDVNILEAIRFYVSFVCAFAFAENKKMIGNADIIALIKKDEAIHLAATQFVINQLQNNKDEGFVDIAKSLQDKAIEMFVKAAEEEKAWASYLFKDGSILGLNETILHQYIEWLTDNRMSQINLPPQFGVKNPIGGWLDKWINPSSVQAAAQEKELVNYRVSSVENDISGMDFGEL